MSELDIEKLRRLRDRRWEPGLTEPAAIGELQAALPAIIAALEDWDRLWRCGAGHIIEIDPGTPPYDMGLCPICAALEDRDRLRAEIRQCLVLAPTDDPDMDGWVLAFRHHKPPSEANWHTPENYPAIAAALESRHG